MEKDGVVGNKKEQKIFRKRRKQSCVGGGKKEKRHYRREGEDHYLSITKSIFLLLFHIAVEYYVLLFCHFLWPKYLLLIVPFLFF